MYSLVFVSLIISVLSINKNSERASGSDTAKSGKAVTEGLFHLDSIIQEEEDDRFAYEQYKSRMLHKEFREEEAVQMAPVGPSNFAQFIANSCAVLKYASSECVRCQYFAPIFSEAARTCPTAAAFGEFRVDTTPTKRFAIAQGVSAIPALHIYSYGRKVAVVPGRSLQDVHDAIHKYC